ncbi:uncharacterized protein LY89DRAFT_735198 [Mollisia scopiformis]|uniref:Uncharacterized protein n=1 Tax=Mollisia scopiformis TaxID=149040 RepID=A0A194X8D7_MOLSC|nr:uncharacterized protein LY89DRAFT_735198 [Mollisia scopiformis]KUJ16057.1 hypothetical protein LY89DRAFT_735198 [Mollisia scopiformis]
MRVALSPRNCFKASFTLVIFSFLVFFFRENLSYGGHKHAIGTSDLDLEEDHLRSNSPWIDSNGFMNPAEAPGYCSRHGWKEYPHRQSRRKIYDLFMINSELDWLEIRLNELQNHVDYFVILESATTFTGLPKPLVLNDSWDNFTQFRDKIIYHVLQDPDPALVKEQKWTQWDHEKFQRNAMFEQVLPRLTDAQAPNHGDVILVSDIDEIPRPAALTVLRNCEFPRRLTLRSRFYYYSFQWLHRGSEWAHPQATTYSTPNTTILPQDLRGGHGAGFFSDEKADLYNAAWHCSSCFATIDEMLLKMQSFSHVEYNEKKFRKKAWIVDHIRKGRDLWDRWGQWYLRIEGNRDVPAYVAEKRERFGYLLDRDGESAGFVDYVPGEEITVEISDDEERWKAADASRDVQDEYLEWSVLRDGEGRIIRAVFTRETPEYWDFLAYKQQQTAIDKICELNAPLLDDVDQKEFFHVHTSDPGNRDTWFYNLINEYNNSTTNETITHLIQKDNNLQMEVDIVAQTTVLRKDKNGKLITDSDQLIRCSKIGCVNQLATTGASVSIADPVAIYINKFSRGSFKLDSTGDQTSIRKEVHCLFNSVPRGGKTKD